MKNICIPNPTLYKIVYVDSRGKQTERVIVPISQTDTSITAYCYHAHEPRTFKKECIESITSTGVHPSSPDRVAKSVKKVVVDY
jgi:predicted DNA-binding transcriptional regulator YafY